MPTTTAPTPLVQPPPERCETPEQAIEIIRLDPKGSREASFATGYLNGWVAGHAYEWDALTDVQAEQKRQAYSTRYAPLTLARALGSTNARAWDEQELETVGWLAGWRDATEGSEHALDCESCSRRLFEDLDGPHHCKVLGIWGCASDTRDCFRGFCYGREGGHATECYGDGS